MPETGFLNLGHFPHPQRELTVNSRYLQLDGKPWMPVMGEFHYSRTPASEWAAELAKLRAGGVNVVASYVIWNHHEPRRGVWRWDGQR
ncbi:MAG: beta-galactosidase, partial [Paucibacter sp.]|nr:beta-galactosidase [Roseateles sp.]